MTTKDENITHKKQHPFADITKYDQWLERKWLDVAGICLNGEISNVCSHHHDAVVTEWRFVLQKLSKLAAAAAAERKTKGLMNIYGITK
jgi:hypothetical protein